MSETGGGCGGGNGNGNVTTAPSFGMSSSTMGSGDTGHSGGGSVIFPPERVVTSVMRSGVISAMEHKYTT